MFPVKQGQLRFVLTWDLDFSWGLKRTGAPAYSLPQTSFILHMAHLCASGPLISTPSTIPPSKSRLDMSSRDRGCGKRNRRGRWIYSGFGVQREDGLVRSREG